MVQAAPMHSGSSVIWSEKLSNNYELPLKNIISVHRNTQHLLKFFHSLSSSEFDTPPKYLLAVTVTNVAFLPTSSFCLSFSLVEIQINIAKLDASQKVFFGWFL